MATQREIADGGGPEEPSVQGLGSAPKPSPAETARLARELTGRLPCARCGYDLRGLSVLEVCPECGTPIRATILAAVDPYAEVLQPLSTPRLTAGGLIVWSAAALIAAALTWALRVGDAYVELAATPLVSAGRVSQASVAAMVVCALAALALAKPHRGVPVWQVLGTVAGGAAIAGAAVVHWKLHRVYDLSHLRPFFLSGPPGARRTWMRLWESALLLVAIGALWPNLRLLAARSLTLRLGKAERQGMRAMVAALAAGAVGDVLHLACPLLPTGAEQVAATIGNFLIAVGSMLFTLGLAGVAVDCLRIAPVLVRPPLSIRQLTSREAAAGVRAAS